MTQSTRRDALKVLAAATGAVTIASLPSRWSKPQLMVGAIPAHAQVSCLAVSVVLNSFGGTIQFNRDQGPAPTTTVGTFPEAGYAEYWACQEGCLELYFHVNTSDTATWTVMIGDVSYTFSLLDDEYRSFLINLSTLAFVTNYASPTNGCSWIGP